MSASNNQDDDVSVVLQIIAETPRGIVIRSLRRRLWKALQREDAEEALAVFTSTRDDWEQWMMNEYQAQRTREQEKYKQLEEEKNRKSKQQQRSSLFDKFASKRKPSNTQSSSASVPSTSHDRNSTGTAVAVSPSSDRSVAKSSVDKADKDSSPFGFLQTCFNPSDPFVIDDYKNPFHDPFPNDLAFFTTSPTQSTNELYTSASAPASDSVEKAPSLSSLLQSAISRSNSYVAATANGDSGSNKNVSSKRSLLQRKPPPPSANGTQQSRIDPNGQGNLGRRTQSSQPSHANSGRFAARQAISFWGINRQGSAEKNEDPSKSKKKKSKKKKKEKKHGGHKHGRDSIQKTSSDDADAAASPFDDPRVTTPLHEAARIGNGALVRTMLESSSMLTIKGNGNVGDMLHQGVDPNSRNGMGRTALHMVAGGLTEEEKLLLNFTSPRDEILNEKRDADEGAKGKATAPIGITVPEPVTVKAKEAPDAELERENPAFAKAAVRAVGRIFGQRNHPSSDDTSKAYGATKHDRKKVHKRSTKSAATAPTSPETIPSVPVRQLDETELERMQELARNRLDVALALLSWCHPEDGSALAGQGSSTNTVDSRGRTALHYAAELGRSDICNAVLSSFGTMLTIVDDRAKTPCELAADFHHYELAAHLEARALLYIDPYGMNDDLLESLLRNNRGEIDSGRRLVTPFAWYETLPIQKAQEEREGRVEKTLSAMIKIILIEKEERAARELLLDSGSDDLSLDGTSKPKAQASIDTSLAELNTESEPAADTNPDRIEEANTQDAESSSDSSSSDSSSSASSSSSSDESGGTGQPNQTTESKAGHNVAEDTTSGEAEISEKPGDEQKTEKSPVSEETAKLSSDTATDSSSDLSVSGDGGITAFDNLNKSHVSRFLAYHQWDRKKALLAFMQGAVRSFEEAGVSIAVKECTPLSRDGGSDEDPMCLICCDQFPPESNEWKTVAGCGHSFCSDCLGDYIADCSASQTSGLTITCPHHDCETLLSPLAISALAPSPEVYESLLRQENEKFVVDAQDFKFCPHPGCGSVVKFSAPNYVRNAGLDVNLLDTVGATCTIDPLTTERGLCTYEGVFDPEYFNARSKSTVRRAHRFCFACGEKGIHWPVTCDRLEQWKTVIREQIHEVEGEDGAQSYDDLAQKLWLKTNTRPCPKCQAPIEKNEGCNHMTCSNPHCKYEFCWICRNAWKLHNTETGGFFRCNRWVDQKEHEFYDKPPTDEDVAVARSEEVTDPSVMNSTYGTAMHAARIAKKKSQTVARFLHHYQRWMAHSESATLERKMSESASSRLEPVVEAAIDFNGLPSFNFDGDGLSFVHDAFMELLECRSMLQHSYAFSFYRYDFSTVKRYRYIKTRMSEKLAFEQIQSDLELLTEQMSDVVARSHLRANKAEIKFLTVAASEKRKEFSNAMISIHTAEKKEFDFYASPESKSQGKKKRRSRDKTIPGILGDAQNDATVETPRLVTSDTATTLQTQETSTPQERNLEEDELEEAIRMSLADMAASGSADTVRGSMDAAEYGYEQTRDWACSACTFVNSQGRHCAMCGTAR